MAQWQDLLRLNLSLQDQVKQLYKDKFPREIRHCLSAWIESQDWDSAAVDECKAKTCLDALLVYLDEQRDHSVKDNNILQAPDFLGMKYLMMETFLGKPLNLAAVLSECLNQEKRILATASKGSSLSAMEHKWAEFENNIEDLRRKTKSTVQQIIHILRLAEDIVGTLTSVELPEWKRRQQMACLGSPADISLDRLQKWFTGVAAVLQQISQLLQDQTKYYNSDASSVPVSTAEILKSTLCLYTKLLSSALVVEKQPVGSKMPQRPLILKTGVRFAVTVRFLVNLPEFKYLSKVKPVFDKDVEEARTIKGFRHFQLSTKGGLMEKMLDASGGGLVAEFTDMLLGEHKNGPKSTNEKRLVVTEELHLIKFVTDFRHAGLEFTIEASSLPLVIISGSNQAVAAWASVMWCNMLSDSEPRNLSLFIDPPPLTWQQLSQVLSWQFLSVGQRELDEDQLSMLRDRIVDDPDDFVPWSRFSKDGYFWPWLDGILDLIKKHLVDLWRDGCIMGFVSKEKSQVLLQEKTTGTFILRFSESSKDGAITFSWVEHCAGGPIVHAVQPYTKEELITTPLPYTLYHYSVRQEGNVTRNPLLYLYPDINKDTAFGRYCNEQQSPLYVEGYLKRNQNHESICPTPPPSPPLDVDMPMDISDDLEKILCELYDFNEQAACSASSAEGKH